jgi:hypothetical protein
VNSLEDAAPNLVSDHVPSPILIFWIIVQISFEHLKDRPLNVAGQVFQRLNQHNDQTPDSFVQTDVHVTAYTHHDEFSSFKDVYLIVSSGPKHGTAIVVTHYNLASPQNSTRPLPLLNV